MRYQVEHDVLIDAVRRDRPHNEVDEAAASTLTAIMGRMASYSGKVVDRETALALDAASGPRNLRPRRAGPRGRRRPGSYPVPLPGVTKAF